MIEPANDPPPKSAFDNTAIPAAYTYFSQLVDHDLTGQNSNVLTGAPHFNKRAAALDLDVIYGTETVESLVGDTLDAITPSELAPQRMYSDDGAFFVLEKTADGHDDLPRFRNPDGTRGNPIVPDARNDENLIVSQLDLAFLKFHNAVARELRSRQPSLHGKALFSKAHRTVVAHYQWIVMNDFLPRVIAGHDRNAGRAYVERIRRSDDRRYTKADVERGMPAEFSVAAYRLGHSMVRFNYRLNDLLGPDGKPIPERQVFNDADSADDLHGRREYPASAIIAWKHFLDFAHDAPHAGDKAVVPQFAMLLDTGISAGLAQLPNYSFMNAGDPPPVPIDHVLAYRNLKRGKTFELPTGLDVAAFYDIVPRQFTILSKTTQAVDGDDFAYGSPEFALTQKFGSHTPLWYYILKEAQDRNGPSGKHLGKLGRRILTECFVAFLEASPQSIFDSGFTPSAGRFGCTTDGDYNLAMLVRYATGQEP